MPGEKYIDKVYTDTIAEKTLDAGVTIDGVKCKDGEVLNSSNVQLANVQDVQNAAADKASYYFDGNTGYVTVEKNANLLFAGVNDSPFTILSIASTKNSATSGIMLAKSTVGYSHEYVFQILSGTLSLELYDTNGSNYLQKKSVASYADSKPHAFCGVYTGNAAHSGMTLYIDGVALSSVTTAGVSYTKMGDKTAPLTIGGFASHDAGYAFEGQMFKNLVFNYALSEDKIKRYSAGAKLDYEDVGGSMTEIVANGSFTGAPATEFLVLGNCSLTTPGNLARFSGVPSGSVYQTKATALPAGKKYKISFTMSSKTGCANATIRPWNISESLGAPFDGIVVVPISSLSNGQTYTWEVVAARDGTLLGLFVNNMVDGDILDIDNFSIIQLGAVLDLEPENITDNTWFDASPNGIHGTVTGAIANRFIPSYSSRNYIINGALEFNQRGTTLTNGTYSADGTFLVDRWKKYTTMSIVPYNGGTLESYIGVATGAGGGTGKLGYIQIIEYPYNLKNKYITLTAAVSGNLTSFTSSAGSPGIYFVINDGITTQYAKVLDAGTNYSSAVLKSAKFKLGNFTGNITVTIMVCGAGGADITTSSSDMGVNVLAGVMLNEGSVAAPFERAGGSISGEELLCKRYYEKSYNVDVAPTSNTSIGLSSYSATKADNFANCTKAFITSKRVNPNVTIYPPDGSSSGYALTSINGATYLERQVTIENTSHNIFGFYETNQSGVNGDSIEFRFHWTADAEI